MVNEIDEAIGYVEAVNPEEYHVAFEGTLGLFSSLHYKFPKKFSRDPLELYNKVRCYIVKTDSGIEPRLERLPDHPPIEKAKLEADEKRLEKLYYKKRAMELKKIVEEYENKNHPENM